MVIVARVMLIALNANLFIDSFENNIDFTSFIESIKMFNNHTTNNVEKQVEARAELKLQDNLLANYFKRFPTNQEAIERQHPARSSRRWG